MALPFEKNGFFTITLKTDSGINEQIIVNDLKKFVIEKGFTTLTDKASQLSFTTNNSLFKIPYYVTVKPEVSLKSGINYTIKLDFLLKVTIIVAITGAFFARLTIEKFIIFEILLITVFYFLNLAVISLYINKLLRSFTENVPYILTADTESTSFMYDTSCCPACGTKLIENTSKCPSCKLFIPTSHGFKTYNPTEIREVKPTEESITYTYIESDKKVSNTKKD